MKIATFNINDVDKCLGNLLAWLKQSSPDVVRLQELKCEQERFPAEAIPALQARSSPCADYAPPDPSVN